MPRVTLLRCPICDGVQALQGKQSSHSKADLYARTSSHLQKHRIDESKAAIRKYGIVADAVELIVSADDLDRLPIGEWQDKSDTWLPADVPSHVGRSLTHSDQTVEATAASPHAED